MECLQDTFYSWKAHEEAEGRIEFGFKDIIGAGSAQDDGAAVGMADQAR